MFSKTWIASGVPIQWIGLSHIITEKSSDIFSIFWNLDTPGIDAFTQSWKVENIAEWFRQFILYSELLLICIIRETRAPLLFHYGSRRVLAMLTNVYYTFIHGLRVLSMSQALIHVRNRNSILGSTTNPRYVVVLRMNVEFLG